MTGAASVIDTAVGAATVLHRLALAVECVDAIREALVQTDVRVGREVSPRLLGPNSDPAWPCLDLGRKGSARALLRFEQRPPTKLRLRLDDPWRRIVPRRFDLPLWSLAEIEAAEQAPPVVPGASLLFRPWLLPGSAARLSRGMTAVRGRVIHGDAPVRWPRVTARGPGNQPVGWAHGDERGEFLLVVVGTGYLPPPPPSELPIDLVVTAPDPAGAVADDPPDPLADLVVEAIARTSSPPLPGELENDLLRGRSMPTGYVASTAVVPTIRIPVGTELTLTAAIPFAA